MKLSWLLFDADNTLLDFTSASKASLVQSLGENGIDCNPAILSTYKSINAQVWTEFENGKITAKHLRRKRFQLLFEAIDVQDIDPEHFSVRYLENLVALSEAYEGVMDTLEHLKSKYRISLVTNGLREVQRPRLSKLKMNHYFESIIVSDEIGSAKPDQKFFKYTFGTIYNPPDKSEVMIIGDNPVSDIQGGREFGIKTCLVSENGNEGIVSDLSIKSVNELPDLLL